MHIVETIAKENSPNNCQRYEKYDRTNTMKLPVSLLSSYQKLLILQSDNG